MSVLTSARRCAIVCVVTGFGLCLRGARELTELAAARDTVTDVSALAPSVRAADSSTAANTTKTTRRNLTPFVTARSSAPAALRRRSARHLRLVLLLAGGDLSTPVPPLAS